jgi:hypothetical protein
MAENPVLKSTEGIVNSSRHVRINPERVEQVGQDYAKLDFVIPDWTGEVFPEESFSTVFNFFMLANTINFAFTDFKTGAKYMTRFHDKEWKGAYGMYAALTQAMEKGVPVLSPHFLKNCSLDDVRGIFCRDTEIPMVEERARIFNEVGRVLEERYGGGFVSVARASEWKLFGDGEQKGLVELLVQDFPSFDDSCIIDGKKVSFNKRAQLGPAEAYSRFLRSERELFPDITKLTAFADYQLPKALRALGILQYSPIMAAKVDAQAFIPAKSRDELEIRANTIHAFDRLLRTINAFRVGNSEPINVLHLDYKLWSEGRALPGKHHLTKTTAY